MKKQQLIAIRHGTLIKPDLSSATPEEIITKCDYTSTFSLSLNKKGKQQIRTKIQQALNMKFLNKNISIFHPHRSNNMIECAKIAKKELQQCNKNIVNCHATPLLEQSIMFASGIMDKIKEDDMIARLEEMKEEDRIYFLKNIIFNMWGEQDNRIGEIFCETKTKVGLILRYMQQENASNDHSILMFASNKIIRMLRLLKKNKNATFEEFRQTKDVSYDNMLQVI